MAQKLDETERLTIKYYDENAEWCSAQDLEPPWFHTDIIPFLIPEGPRLLDIGCGIGRYIPAFQQIGISEGSYVGIDPSKAMLEIARSRYPGFDFQEVDLYSLTEHFPSGHFNTYAAIMTLAHVTPMKMQKALYAIQKVLCRGAKGIIVMQGTNNTLRMVNGVPQDHTFRGPAATFAGWTFDRLEPKLTKAGFKVRLHAPNIDGFNFAVLTESV